MNSTEGHRYDAVCVQRRSSTNGRISVGASVHAVLAHSGARGGTEEEQLEMGWNPAQRQAPHFEYNMLVLMALPCIGGALRIFCLTCCIHALTGFKTEVLEQAMPLHC